jgi:pSer/pThr/pTyr-binding forkhead associated (FHA) protein
VSALKQNLFKAIDFLIRVESGPDAGKAYRIQPPRINIGRDPQCHIALTDPKVSRKQVTISFKDNVVCEDVSTRKNTLINGKACGKTVLKPGDKISFGQTVLMFQTRTNESAKPQLAGKTRVSEGTTKLKTQKQIRLFLVGIVLMVGLILFLEEEAAPKKELKLVTMEDLNKQIEETEERTSLLNESREEKRKMNDRKYLYGVERHFIAGFRDFQNGRYGRALDSFGTTIATEPGHTRARLYSKAAKKKRSDLIDTHIRDGKKYKEKLMYNRCAAEFEKALVLINDVNSQKYKLARTQLIECRLLKTGGYQ